MDEVGGEQVLGDVAELEQGGGGTAGGFQSIATLKCHTVTCSG
jgi:hypothetical protein